MVANKKTPAAKKNVGTNNTRTGQSRGAAADKNPTVDKNKNENDVEGYQGVRKPSISYHENSSTFSYRLSELIFGSLLASYDPCDAGQS